GGGGGGRAPGPPPLARDALRDRAGYRDLLHGILGERHANRVAEAVGQERSDADRALDAAVLAVARLGDADVERVVARPAAPCALGERRREQSIRLDRDLRIARLHREDDVVEALVLADVPEP